MGNKHLQIGLRLFAFGFFLGVLVTRMFHEAFVGIERYDQGNTDSLGTDRPMADKLRQFNMEKNKSIRKNNKEGTVDAKEPVVKERKVQEPVVEKTKVQEPVVEKTKVQEPVQESAAEKTKVQEQVVEKTKVQEPIVQDKKHEIVDFERQDHVVIATKIHGEPHVPQLKQSLCLFTSAYNRRLKYDIIVFATMPLPEYDIRDMQEIVHPAHLSIVTDKKTLHQQIQEMTQEQRDYLLKRCNQTSVDDLSWGVRCQEDQAATMPLAYSWQSEFRSKHLWKQAALKPYKYMLWLDSDAMCTETWKQDPVAEMIRNDLVILFDNFPQGSSKGKDVQERIQKSFNQSLCRVGLQDGHLHTKDEDCGAYTRISQIHGFFHLTNLDFFRSEAVLKWADVLIGDTKFSRRWDDQLAVTVPPAVLAPQRAWDMRSHGIRLNVYHNGFLDGKEKWRGGGFIKWWATNGKNFTEAYPVCKRRIVNGGR